MKLYYPITVDLYNTYPLKKMTAQQNNIGRGVDITLSAGGAVIDPSDEVVNLHAKKPDGTKSYIKCEVVSGKIRATFTNQMLAVPGKLIVELQLISGEEDITTPIFEVEVQESEIDRASIESQDEFTALQKTLSEVADLKKNGLKGDPGESASIEIGTVTASEAGSSPQVTNSGTEQKAVLEFVLPRGAEGPEGPAGPDTSGLTSDAFDESMSYEAGDFAIYQDVLYKFTSAKAAGAWDVDAVSATKVDAELQALRTAADELNSKMQETEEVTYTNHYFDMTFRFMKKNGLVQVYASGNTASSVPAGDLGELFTIDEIFKPYFPIKFVPININTGAENIQFTIQTSGSVEAYNYGSALTSAKLCRICQSYVSNN